MSQQRGGGVNGVTKEALLKSYQKRLRDGIKAMADNFTEVIKLAKNEDDSAVMRPTQAEQDYYEMEVRSANIVRAGESLVKLIADMKQFFIVNSFTLMNESILNNTKVLEKTLQENDSKLQIIRDEIATDLLELEEEYYLSPNK
jgi:mediator of RNA polymerase II transcription subunit 22